MPADLGRIKRSFANLLYLRRPLVIVDEAHNAGTPLSFETLRRIRPAAVIELTATPATDRETGSNVLYSVSALELKAEDMIKLPVMLFEHPQGWENAVGDAILTRNRLADLAPGEAPEYVRPLVLFQAEDKGGVVTVEVLKKHLLEQRHIPEQEIAIATGRQRELDGIDLFDPACKIRYIITIEALKEGWDCSFAYVFCSVKRVQSDTAVEQLLGRVLRMPYARQRKQDALNRAYAHLISPEFAQAAERLKDRLVHMGFDPLEAAVGVQPGTLPLWDDPADLPPAPFSKPEPAPLVLTVEKAPDLADLPEAVRERVQVQPAATGFRVTLRGDIDETLEQALLDAVPEKRREEMTTRIRRHQALQQALTAPAARGAQFAPLPRLGGWVQGEFELLEKESFVALGGWSLAAAPARLEFSLQEQAQVFMVDIDASRKRMEYSAGDPRQIDLDQAPAEIGQTDLIRWLDREIQRGIIEQGEMPPDFTQAEMLAWLARLLTYLRNDRGLPLTGLARARYPLARAIRKEIERLRAGAAARGYQLLLQGVAEVALDDHPSFEFKPGHYPARNPYSGRYRFRKHYYELIDNLKETGEEFHCARIIDTLPEIRHWVRNPAKQQQLGFWLGTPQGRFYPDFIAELNDGRLLVVEYKGAHLEDGVDAAVKRQIGERWAKASQGNCLFVMVTRQDEAGRDIRAQLRRALAP